jgi:hypothetical protein
VAGDCVVGLCVDFVRTRGGVLVAVVKGERVRGGAGEREVAGREWLDIA